jgi:SAM-dependent methyltransferase
LDELDGSIEHGGTADRVGTCSSCLVVVGAWRRRFHRMRCNLSVTARSDATVDLRVLVSGDPDQGPFLVGGPADEIQVLQEERPLLTGGSVWVASAVIEGFLNDLNVHWDGARVLELGSGTGWLALKMARRGASVTATDRRGMLDLLMRNVLRNQKKYRCTDEEDLARGRVTELDVECVELDWEDGAVLPGRWDVIVGIEAVYLQQFHQALAGTIRRHAGPATRIFVCWEERMEDGQHRQGDFLLQARAAGLREELRIVSRTPTSAPCYGYELHLQSEGEDGATPPVVYPPPGMGPRLALIDGS